MSSLFQLEAKHLVLSVSSFREIEWQSFSPNFFFILSPAAGRELPNSYITSIKLENSQKFMNNFTNRFPTITSVNLEAIIEQGKSSLSKRLIGCAIYILSYVYSRNPSFNCFCIFKQRSANQRNSNYACHWSQ